MGLTLGPPANHGRSRPSTVPAASAGTGAAGEGGAQFWRFVPPLGRLVVQMLAMFLACVVCACVFALFAYSLVIVGMVFGDCWSSFLIVSDFWLNVWRCLDSFCCLFVDKFGSNVTAGPLD